MKAQSHLQRYCTLPLRGNRHRDGRKVSNTVHPPSASWKLQQRFHNGEFIHRPIDQTHRETVGLLDPHICRSRRLGFQLCKHELARFGSLKIKAVPGLCRRQQDTLLKISDARHNRSLASTTAIFIDSQAGSIPAPITARGGYAEIRRTRSAPPQTVRASPSHFVALRSRTW
jgi:hypothetical protein